MTFTPERVCLSSNQTTPLRWRRQVLCNWNIRYVHRSLYDDVIKIDLEISIAAVTSFVRALSRKSETLRLCRKKITEKMHLDTCWLFSAAAKINLLCGKAAMRKMLTQNRENRYVYVHWYKFVLPTSTNRVVDRCVHHFIDLYLGTTGRGVVLEDLECSHYMKR